MNSLLERVIPFVFLGIIAVLLCIGVVVFSYILVIGSLVGLAFFLVAWIRAKFFSPQYTFKDSYKIKRGRIIEHDDFKF